MKKSFYNKLLKTQLKTQLSKKAKKLNNKIKSIKRMFSKIKIEALIKKLNLIY